MKRACVLAAFGTLALVCATFAQSQAPPVGDKPSQPSARAEPMSLQGTAETKTVEESRGGFWMFPEPAPLGSIVTDRPGFSSSATLVPRGRTQIESGYTFTYDREGKKRVIDHTFPEIGLRTGLMDWLELRVNWAGGSLTETLDVIKTPAGRRVGHEDHDDGCTDMSVGFKLPLIRDREGLPNVSIIPSLGIPTGRDSKSANNVVPEIKLPWNYSVTPAFTVYGSVLGRVQDGPGGQFFQTAATLAGGYKVSDRVTLYLEYFGVYPNAEDSDCAHVLSAGPIIKISDNVSLDMRASAGLNEEAPDFQASIGFGIRF